MAAPIYLDNNATTQIAPEVFEAMRPYLTAVYGNPSSSHSSGHEAKIAVETARTQVASLLGASDPSEIVFTSCGTESDNWAIRGALSARPEKRHIMTTRVEHEAVRNLCLILEKQGWSVTWIDVDNMGLIDLDDLKRSLRKETAIVSIMLANNETGVLFPVNAAAAVVRENSGALFHVDAVNAAGKIAIDVESSAIDLMSISGHKFHGPKGIGALYVRRGTKIDPYLIGGGQQGGARAGTEAIHQIAGLAAAAGLAVGLDTKNAVAALRDRLETAILAKIPNCYINGTSDNDLRLPNTSCISFEGINGEMILHRLDAAGVSVSTGSACHSQDHSPSAVLQAMNVPYSRAMGAIRFSLGRYNTGHEIDEVIGLLPPIIEELAKFSN